MLHNEDRLVLLSAPHTEWCRNNGVVMPSPLAERPSQEQQGQERQPGLQPPVEQQRQQEGKEPERVKEGAQHQQESQEMEFSPPPEQRDTIATQVLYMCRIKRFSFFRQHKPSEYM